nr:putative helicase [Quercus suber]
MPDDAPESWDDETPDNWDEGEEAEQTVTEPSAHRQQVQPAVTDRTSSAATGDSTAPDTVDNSDIDNDDSDSEYEFQDGPRDKKTRSVLGQYQRLLSRRVDLVGDYAGNELFLIEGDSMLLRCFSDDLLDFDNGFQMLHAAYIVEHFLHHLVQRKCNFHIAFFDSNRDICLPPRTSKRNAAKYFLVRAAIIRHIHQAFQDTLGQARAGTSTFEAPDSRALRLVRQIFHCKRPNPAIFCSNLVNAGTRPPSQPQTHHECDFEHKLFLLESVCPSNLFRHDKNPFVHAISESISQSRNTDVPRHHWQRTFAGHTDIMPDDAPESWDDETPDNWDEGEEAEQTVTEPSAHRQQVQPAVTDRTSSAATGDSTAPDTVDNSDIDNDDSDSEYEFQDGPRDKKTRSVLGQYQRLLSRRVDLVGDYAGNELFLIEGDSMLLRCFSDDLLDFDNGFQMLHAAYIVEHFLHHLVQRKCNFHIAFFDSNRDICLPPRTSKRNAAKYFLARAAIIRHLQVNLKSLHPGIIIHKFSSYNSTDFEKCLQAIGPYFIMAHDGALPMERKGKHIQKSEATPVEQDNRFNLRMMIIHFIRRGFNVALVNGLEWRDTKIMTMVLERKDWRSEVQEVTAFDDQIVEFTGLDVSTDVKLEEVSQLPERQQLAVVIVAKLIRNPPETTPKESLLQSCAAFLIHAALLQHLSLSCRRVEDIEVSGELQDFVNEVATLGERILADASWAAAPRRKECTCDIVDFVDGRLLAQVRDGKVSLDSAARKTLDNLLAVVETLSAIHLTVDDAVLQGSRDMNGTKAEAGSPDLSVMPFSNAVFDKHLASVRLKEDDAAAGEQTLASHKVFKEMTHWHNAKKPIVVKAPPTPQSIKQEFWAAKRNQLFMAEMRTYAASLTNAVGKSLEPETIIVGATKPAVTDSDRANKGLAKRTGVESPADSDVDSNASNSKGKPGGKKVGGKNAAKNAGKQAMLDSIAATKAKKDEAAGNKIANAWQVACKNFDADKDPRSRYRQAKDYLTRMQPAWREVVAAECELYMLSALLQFWIDVCRRGDRSKHMELTALIWNTADKITSSSSLTKQIAACIELTIRTLGLPTVPSVDASTLPDRKLAFTFPLPSKVEGLSTRLNPKDFQLIHGGPYLERSFDSAEDNRVKFQPDGWQREVLDGIDANKSLFVVAPTSAGKTFISFYAMEKILKASDDDVLVYVAPTKALVNQIAAEIQARFSKNFKYGGKSVYAIHTRDYRINNVLGAQVLVTVPHVLQIMLLAPSNANAWSSRVKRIIFDEVHSIGQAEDGVVWEQLLLLAPCPIIALSATVGNPGEFSAWLTTTQKSIGVELKTVHHPHRYSDLRKYYYVAPQKFGFHGLHAKSAFGSLGLEGLTGFNYVHPVAGLVDKSRGIPEDLALEPRDCLYLWQSMTKHATADYPVPKKLDPSVALPDISRKVDILKWEKDLKALLQQWLIDSSSPFDYVLLDLAQTFRNAERENVLITNDKEDLTAVDEIQNQHDVIETTLPLLCRLHQQDALPAILFNYDRHQCEKICQTLTEKLQEKEQVQQKTGAKWQKTLERWEEWKKAQAKAASKKGKIAPKKGSKGEDDDEMGSKLDQQRDASEQGIDAWESFDPEKPLDGYHFADHTRVQASELEIYVKQLGRRNVPQWLIDSIGRGIGVHHAGMNRKYRQVVEILFRKGFLRVIIATGTLALGINMPCKTVVFSGDSVFLTALNYRQCAGRAGRRGFDLLGNVVFQGLSRHKVCRLISSRLPDLNGHFPITTTLVLRLFTLLHESKGAKYAVAAINALLSQPRMYMGGASFKDQTMHHLRFSIEYLRRQHLLDARGATLNFAGLVSHLYFTENSAFGFHALLKEGYFHELCAGIKTNERDTLETLMLVMAHLFNRIPCRQSDIEYREKVVKPSSSVVFLPPMPAKASQILRNHNQQTLQIFKTYVETFVDQHIDEEDRTLPLTGITAGGAGTDSSSFGHQLPSPKVRSPFVALSGVGDEFQSIHDLCQTTRDGVFLEEAVIPHLDVSPDEMDVPLNAWLLDFYKHGDVHTIERANGIRSSDIWFLLNDFSLVMATIITSLLNFMKLQEGTDIDMLDIMGSMDAHEEAEDDKVASSEDQSVASGPSIADSAISIPERTRPAPVIKKAKNAESWEDVANAEDTIIESEERRAATAARLQAEEEAEGDSDWNEKGLKDVLKALQKLHAEFTVKFKAMWA